VAFDKLRLSGDFRVPRTIGGKARSVRKLYRLARRCLVCGIEERKHNEAGIAAGLLFVETRIRPADATRIRPADATRIRRTVIAIQRPAAVMLFCASRA
jgi:hypothetical protein